ncbi:hypothetical protein [Arhodomonas sp. AD133]|uniref:hypothetical protein n=1 Tax=Arhodomonas sp. AD133 TaxID=3415009 RepID=UPI003EB9DC7E
MADIRISELTDGGPVQPTDDVPVERGGTTRRAQVGSAAAADLASTGGTVLENDKVVVGAPSGGDMGEGTVNGSLYDQGRRVMTQDQVTISNSAPTGVPADGEQWIIYA